MIKQFYTLALLDAPTPWQIGFQDPASPIIIGIIDFHNYLIFFLTLIGTFVFWILFRGLALFTKEDKNPSRKPSNLFSLRFTNLQINFFKLPIRSLIGILPFDEKSYDAEVFPDLVNSSDILNSLIAGIWKICTFLFFYLLHSPLFLLGFAGFFFISCLHVFLIYDSSCPDNKTFYNFANFILQNFSLYLAIKILNWLKPYKKFWSDLLKFYKCLMLPRLRGKKKIRNLVWEFPLILSMNITSIMTFGVPALLFFFIFALVILQQYTLLLFYFSFILVLSLIAYLNITQIYFKELYGEEALKLLKYNIWSSLLSATAKTSAKTGVVVGACGVVVFTANTLVTPGYREKLVKNILDHDKYTNISVEETNKNRALIHERQQEARRINPNFQYEEYKPLKPISTEVIQAQLDETMLRTPASDAFKMINSCFNSSADADSEKLKSIKIGKK